MVGLVFLGLRFFVGFGFHLSWEMLGACLKNC